MRTLEYFQLHAPVLKRKLPLQITSSFLPHKNHFDILCLTSNKLVQIYNMAVKLVQTLQTQVVKKENDLSFRVDFFLSHSTF